MKNNYPISRLTIVRRVKQSLFFILFALASINAQALITVNVTNPTNTTPNLLASYSSLSDALTALNAVSAMTGPVILSLDPGSETAPVTGFTIGSATLNPVLSSTNTVTIVKASGTVTLNAGVGTATPGTAIQDGILKIVGADWITIDGLTLVDGNAANPATMEYGIALYKASVTDGSQNNTIQNCNITLNRINNAGGTAPMQDGSIGIYVGNSLATTATTVLVPTAASGTNSANKFYTNTIQNCNIGISLSGYAATVGVPTPPLGDLGNDVGGSSLATGNIIKNYGGGAVTSPAAGIRTTNQWEINISYNNINNNDGGGVNHATTLRGIYAQSGLSGNATINNNTVSIKCAAATSASTAIENVIGATAASNTVNINNNTIENCTYLTATSGTFTGILNGASAATVNINGNTINNNSVGTSGTASTGVFQGIYSSVSATNLNMNTNTVTNNVINNQGGTMYCMRASTSIFTVNGNIINNNSIPNSGGALTCTLYGFYDGSSPTGETFQNNQINNLSISGASTSTSSLMAGIYTTTAAGSKTWSGNTIHSIIFTNSSSGTATVNGIQSALSTTINIYKNKIYNLSASGATSLVSGILVSSGSTAPTVNIYNNLIGDLKSPNGNNALVDNIRGINITLLTANANVNVYYNTVYLAAVSTGTNFTTSAMFATVSTTATTGALTLRNNILINKSTPMGTGLAIAYRRSAGIANNLNNFTSASNNNLFYAGTPGVSNLIYYDGTSNAQTLALYQGGVFTAGTIAPRDAASVSADVNFLSTTGSSPNFLHVNTGFATVVDNGAVNIATFTDDYDTDIRAGNPGYLGTGTNPDIGADEFDLTLVCIDPPTPGTSTATPSGVACANSSVTLNLTGNTSGVGQTYQWQSSTLIGGPYTNVGSLQTAASLAVTALTPLYYQCEIICSGGTPVYSTPVFVDVDFGLPGGTYTINSAVATGGGNYQTFADAVNAMRCGILGPVVFNVDAASGPYSEQVIIPSIAGTSAINTVTFNGNGRSILFAPTVSGQNAIIRLNGADYVTFDNFLIFSTSTTFGYGVQMMNDADNNTISHCTITVDQAQTSTSTSAFAGILINSTTTAITTVGASLCDNNTIDHNTIIGGYAGIAMVGSGTTSMINNNKITNNTITEFYEYGIYMNGNNNSLVELNDISRPARATVTTFRGIGQSGVSLNARISKNRMHNPFGGSPSATTACFGIYFTTCDATVGNENLVSNNVIYDFKGTTGNRNAVLNVGSDYVKYYHNTITLDDVSATCTACAARGFYQQTPIALGLEYKNNVVSISQGGDAPKQCIYFDVNPSSVFVSDDNDFYMESTGGAINDIGFVNATSYHSMLDWQTGSGQDLNSVSINPLFVNPGAGNLQPGPLAFGLDNIGSPLGITTDITGAARSMTTPDPGAYEFTEAVAFSFSGLTLTPSTGQCAAQIHHVSVSADNAPGGMSYVHLIYSFDGGPNSTVVMTNTGGNIWEGDIPAATPTDADVTWYVEGNDGTFTKTSVGVGYRDNYLADYSISGSTSPSSPCPGDIITLNAVVGAVGTASIANNTTTLATTGNPLRAGAGTSWQVRTQLIVRASELIAAGIAPGNLTSLAFTTVGTGGVMGGFTIFMAQTSQTDFATTTFLTPTFTTVYGPAANFTPTPNTVNTYTFIAPFAWDGTSNLLIEVQGVNVTTGTTTVQASTPGFTGTLYAASTTAFAATTGTTSATRATMIFGGIVGPPGFTYSWSGTPAGHGLITTTGSTVTALPSASGTYDYTVTATETGGCTLTYTLQSTVNTAPATPIGNSNSQCGYGTPIVSVSGGGGTFHWYLFPTGGTPIQSSTSTTLTNYPIDQTTTFYVSETNGGPCPSFRVPVTSTVNPSDSVAASASANNICPGVPITHTATKFGSSNTYTSYTWSASPVSGSGIPTTLTGQSVQATPTASGTYIYTVVAHDASSGCGYINRDTVIVSVAPFDINAGFDQAVCTGTSATLSIGGSATVQVGTATTTTTTNQLAPYTPFWETTRLQYLVTASELTAAGLLAGPIDAIQFKIAASTAARGWDAYTIKMALTTDVVLTAAWINAGLTTVFGPVNLPAPPAVGFNNHTLSTPFVWDGTSSIVIDICHSNDPTATCASCYSATGSVTTEYTATSFNSVHYQANDNQENCATAVAGTLSANRVNMRFVSGVAVTWTSIPPGFTATGPTVNTGIINSVTSYVAHVSNGICEKTDTVNVVVVPVPAAPGVNGSIQCGTGVPECYVIGSGSTFNWYLTPTGGTAISNEHAQFLSSYSINSTTTFYVAEDNGTCEGDRSIVDAFVFDPDAVTASITEDTICPGTSVTLSVGQTGSNNTYTFDWTVYPNVAGSGISGSASGPSVIITPTDAGIYSYIVTAFDASGPCTTKDTVTLVVNAPPNITAVSASANPVCAGNPVTLIAKTQGIGGGDTIRIGTGTTSFTGACTPYYRNSYEGYKTQFLVKASALIAKGMHAGNINAISFIIVTNGFPTSNYSNGLTFSMANTNAADVTNWITTGLQTVWGPTNYSPILGVNNHVFTTPFNWDGVSNIVIQACRDNDPNNTCASGCTGNNPAIMYTSGVGYAATKYYGRDNTTESTRNICDTTASLGTQTNLPNIGFTQSSNADSLIWTWNPGGLSNDTVTVTPTGPTTYTVTALDTLTGCSTSETIAVDVNQAPLAPPTTPSTQCGAGIPGASATAQGGGALVWYTDQFGGTPIQTSFSPTLTSYSITISKEFWVAESDGICEGPRSSVQATVTPGDVVTASSSLLSFCVGTSTLLESHQVGSTNNYVFTWTASPLTGSGMTGPVQANSLSVTPTAPGTYTYILTGFDAATPCNTSASVTVTVQGPPNIVNVTASPNPVCAGSITHLSAQAIEGSFGTTSVGAGATTSATYSNPFYSLWSNAHDQYLIPASELHAAGLGTGNITSLGVSITVAGTLPMIDFSLKIGTTNATNMSSYVSTSFSTVYTNASYMPIVGLNPMPFSTPFYWDGIQNIVVEICHGNPSSTATMSRTCQMDNTAYVSTIHTHKTTSTGGSVQCTDNTTNVLTYSARPKFTFSGVIGSDVTSSMTWQWNPGALPGASTDVTPPAGTTNYIVTATSSAGCTNSASVSVTAIATPPTPIISSAVDTICTSGTAHLSFTNSLTGASIQWQDSIPGGAWTNISGATDTAFTTPTLTTTTFYRVYSGCTLADTSVAKGIVVGTATVVSTTGTQRCGPGPANLSVNGVGVITWYTAITGGTLVNTGPTYSAIVTSTVTYWVQSNFGSCVNSGGRKPVSIVVTSAPTVSIAASPGNAVCIGQPITLTASSSNDPRYTYYWSTDGVNPIHIGVVHTETPSATTTYYVYGVDSVPGATYGCAAFSSKVITVNPVPNVPIISPTNAAVCSVGGSANLFVSNPETGVNLQSVGPLDLSIGAATAVATYYVKFEIFTPVTIQSVKAFWTTSGSAYTIIIRDSATLTTQFSHSGTTVNSGITTPDIVTLNATLAPGKYQMGFLTNPGCYRNSTGASYPYTIPGTVSITGNTFNNAAYYYYFYDWKVQVGTPATYAWTPGGAVGVSVSVSPVATTNYTVTSSFATGCSATSAPVSVAYTPMTPITIVPSGPTTFCAGGSVTLDAGAGYSSYSWSDGVSVVGTAQTYLASPSSTTTYTVTVGDGGVCTVSESVVVTISVPATPTITGGPLSFCNGGDVLLDAGSGYSSYSWSDGASVVGSSQTYTASASGTYTVTVSNALGCTTTNSVVVNEIVVTPPVITPVGDLNLCDDGSNSVLLDANGPFTGYDVLWNDVDANTSEDLTVLGTDATFDAFTNPFGFSVTITDQVTGCSASSAPVTLTRVSCGIELTTSIFIEGYYAGASAPGLMDNFGAGGCLWVSSVDGGNITPIPGVQVNDVDTVFISAMNSTTYAEVDRQWGLLQTDGSITVKFSAAVTPGSYYLKVNSRNTVETWGTLITLPLTGPYKFSDGNLTDYWFNMGLVDAGLGIYANYSGDIADDFGTSGVQNGYFEGVDFSASMDGDIQAGNQGYLVSDLDGDGFCTNFDFIPLDPHIQSGAQNVLTP